MAPKILVVDDEPKWLRIVSLYLGSRNCHVETALNGEEAIHKVSAEHPDLIIADIGMPGMDGYELCSQLRRDASTRTIPFIFLTARDQDQDKIKARKVGADDYLTKPFGEQELELAIRNAFEKQLLQDEVRTLRKRLGAGAEEPVSGSASMLRIREVARQVADTDAPVLITGESGVGKEVLARFIHAHSGRQDGPFVKVNCAALPQELLESELFGYERGAFSGALRDKPGKFELAHRGSILLDEIGEMSPHLQAKLLHVLQDGEYSRLGARRPLTVDARVLATTNARLAEAVAAGRFREDLYFRLDVIRIEIPPLRERREDIPLLCEHFLRLYADKYKSAVRELPPDVLEAFLAHDWPGNVRELENAVRRYLILPSVAGSLLRRKDAPSEAGPDGPAAAAAPSPSLRAVAARAAELAERELVERVLEETRWNRREASRRLKISYKGLLNKLKKWKVAQAGGE